MKEQLDKFQNVSIPYFAIILSVLVKLIKQETQVYNWNYIFALSPAPRSTHTTMSIDKNSSLKVRKGKKRSYFCFACFLGSPEQSKPERPGSKRKLSWRFSWFQRKHKKRKAVPSNATPSAQGRSLPDKVRETEPCLYCFRLRPVSLPLVLGSYLWLHPWHDHTPSTTFPWIRDVRDSNEMFCDAL